MNLLIVAVLIVTTYNLHSYFKKYFSKTPLISVFMIMVDYVIIVLLIMTLLTWQSFY